MDGNLSFNAAASVAMARQIIKAYKQKRRVLARAHQIPIDVRAKRRWLRDRLRFPHERGKRNYVARRLFIGEAYNRTIH